MNIIKVILYEKLHRYVYDKCLDLKKKSNTTKEIYWYNIYKQHESSLKGWRIVLAIWFPFIRKYRRYAYYKAILMDYELRQVSKLTRYIYKLKLWLINIQKKILKQ